MKFEARAVNVVIQGKLDRMKIKRLMTTEVYEPEEARGRLLAIVLTCLVLSELQAEWMALWEPHLPVKLQGLPHASYRVHHPSSG